MKLRIAFACTLLLILFAVIHTFRSKPDSDSGNRRPDKVQKNQRLRAENPGTAPAVDSSGQPAAIDTAAATAPVAGLAPAARKIYDQIVAALQELKSGVPVRRTAALATLNQLLSGEGHDPEASIGAIMAFLKTGQDSDTGELFSVGEKGMLDTSSTLRVFLLDQLGTLSLDTNDMTAVTVAHEILSRFASADEWAVCLRNVAWLEPENTAYLTSKASDLLANSAWQQNPSRGFLEAFDVVVHSGAAQLIPQLQAFLATSEDNPLWRAASVALDGLAQAHADTTMRWLNDHPDALGDTPGQRSDYFAKADLANAAQRSLVEAYLNRGDVSAEEKGSFLERIIAPGMFVSNNLITEPHATPGPDEERARLANLNRVGREWLDSNRFPQLDSKLRDFVRNTGPNRE